MSSLISSSLPSSASTYWYLPTYMYTVFAQYYNPEIAIIGGTAPALPSLITHLFQKTSQPTIFTRIMKYAPWSLVPIPAILLLIYAFQPSERPQDEPSHMFHFT
ncbi:hypothetical protein BU24DRAFT_208187 [Aaosphaeria arxii CBS 175.79]|uniref:Uncharacterized protein n=1 Tax=Aaosphaeria arxii CBS 175.79 TaxID=1450172 RepID=A0A6A5XUV0_9PLEO|nr:uncharacterized protein BU24DRAFT_208187 [Aaosphaeria arxii CBS 175.79]KAF2016709.1 hypothetical protein BU24DRAFT_208187 [Aaosphaeria arxii CBS 175.79]